MNATISSSSAMAVMTVAIEVPVSAPEGTQTRLVRLFSVS